jgi:3-phosphoshikimate 1-carboxyvinyltransferase
MKQYLIKKDDQSVKGTIHLDGSKSLSNRVLIIQALCKDSFTIEHCSTSDDSKTLQQLLSEPTEVYDAHHAGTTFRFLCSFLALQEGDQVLTGSKRMKERPIGALVDALRAIGADIQYIEKEGYPPLRIGHIDTEKYNNHISIPAGISSQFISSLLLISPQLSNGLNITMVGDLVSRPYLEMTLKVMEYFGVQHQ